MTPKLIIMLVIASICLTACGSEKITLSKYRDNYYELRDLGVDMCLEQNFDYVGLEMPNFQQGIVICNQKSPKLIKRYEVTIK